MKERKKKQAELQLFSFFSVGNGFVVIKIAVVVGDDGKRELGIPYHRHYCRSYYLCPNMVYF